MTLSQVADLRSDTLTKPNKAMRAAMAGAVLGDDVYGEDPEVNKLQEKGAALFKKDAALFVPSGTMGNLIAMMAHTCHERGLEVMLGDQSHIYNYEAGGAAAVGGLVFHVLPTQPNGQIALDTLDKAYRNRPNDPHCPRPGVLCLENTHNRCGGAVLPLEYMRDVAAWAEARSIPVHLDGARVFNAAVALDVPVHEIAQHVTSVSFCLSKVLLLLLVCCFVCSVSILYMYTQNTLKTHTQNTPKTHRVCHVQWAPSSWVLGHLYSVPIACAKCWVGACGRWACWRPPGWLPFRMTRYGDWPWTTSTPCSLLDTLQLMHRALSLT